MDGLSESATTDRAQRWAVGLGLAAVVAVYAASCVFSQHAWSVAGTRPVRLVELQGVNAIAMGAAYLSVALFMHFHWFWSAHPVYHGFAQLGKAASLIGLASALGYLFYNTLILN